MSKRLALVLVALVAAGLYFAPDVNAGGRLRHRSNDCECGSCECGGCDSDHGRRGLFRRHRHNDEGCHETCCNHVAMNGCWGGYGCGGCVGLVYQPVVTYRPVAVYRNYGCLGSVSCGCCGNYGVGVVGGGGRWEWKPDAKPMPPGKPDKPGRPNRPNRPDRDDDGKDKDGGDES
jgi:hypothetical protein